MMDVKIIHEDFSKSENLARFLSLNDPNVFRYEYLTYMPDKYVYVTAWDANNDIVGIQALMPYVLNIDGKDVLTGRSERTLVLGALRGQGILASLYDECIRYGREKGMQFVWGTTAAIKAFQKWDLSSTMTIGSMRYAVSNRGHSSHFVCQEQM